MGVDEVAGERAPSIAVRVEKADEGRDPSLEKAEGLGFCDLRRQEIPF